MSGKKPYFPATLEHPDCTRCERKNCYSRGKYQRGTRSFSYLSGRCPRLPDMWGRLEPEDAAQKGAHEGGGRKDGRHDK